MRERVEIDSQLPARFDQLAAVAHEQRLAIDDKRQFRERPREVWKVPFHFGQLAGNQPRRGAALIQRRKLPGDGQLGKIEVCQPVLFLERHEPAALCQAQTRET